MSNFALSPLFYALAQTIYMVFVSSALSIILGTALGILLFSTEKTQTHFYQAIAFIVNATRSIPFIILMISIIPFTRFLIGTSIGTNAAIVSLTLAAIPFYARIAESALQEVPKSLLETAYSLGATRFQQYSKFLIPEALPALIKGGTLTVISLIGYSAMAGAVGGGGLGELAINYGYERFDPLVMLETVVILIVLVQFLQWIGDYCAKYRSLKPILLLSVCLIFGAGSYFLWENSTPEQTILKVGIIGGKQQAIFKTVQKIAKKDYNIQLKPIVFQDYVLPNIALAQGDIDANVFQHQPYLDAQVRTHHFPLISVAKTFVYPMGFYSEKIKNIQLLHERDLIAIPNDPSNQGRALLLLEKAKLISLNPKSGLFASPQDIIDNPKHLRFIALNAAQLPRALKDAVLVAITNDYIGPIGYTVNDALIKENAKSLYANIIVTRKNNAKAPNIINLIQIMHSKAIEKQTLRLYPSGGAIRAW